MKVTTRISVRGVDLKDMIAQAREQVSDLSDAEFVVTDVDVYPIDDIATQQGMARLWSASLTLEANLKV